MAQTIGIKSIKSDSDFNPSMKSLLRIFKVLTENDTKCRTRLSLDTHLNYARLAKHVLWMEKKGLVESSIKDNKINISLTRSGREFSSLVVDIF